MIRCKHPNAKVEDRRPSGLGEWVRVHCHDCNYGWRGIVAPWVSTHPSKRFHAAPKWVTRAMVPTNSSTEKSAP